MNDFYRFLIMTTAALAVVVVLALAALPAQAQLPTDPAERAKVVDQIFQANARQLTLFDRQGKPLSQIGTRDMYGAPALSPDGKRVAVIKADIDKETNDLWVLDVATGKGIKLTSSQAREGANSPVWSPDGSHLAYVALRGGNFSAYRKASTGEGSEELLYRSPGILTLTDWSVDGRFLSFFSTDLNGGAFYALPLDGAGERKPIEVFRNKFQLQGAHLSPDGRFMSYVSNESGKNEVYVRPFNPTATANAAPTKGPWQISKQNAQGITV